ncbi:MAG: septation protein SpoVG family protein [Elusimicrobia bacterium]|nr:septation protein SpoVG family protein [Elusimicrobiota bacterium]
MDNLPKLDARVRPYQDPSDRPTKLMAFAELIIADAFVIKGIRVLKKAEPGTDEPFVVFPAEKGKGATADRWFDLAHPVTAEARTAAITLIMDKYRQLTGTTARAAAGAEVPF